MNRAESISYQPTGAGLRWYADVVYDWLHPKPRAAKKRDPEFAKAVDERILAKPRTIDEIYKSMPARFRTVTDYRNLAKQLMRRCDQKRVVRMGLLGDYRYFKPAAKKMPKL